MPFPCVRISDSRRQLSARTGWRRIRLFFMEKSMKLTTLLLVLCTLNSARPEPLATGSAVPFPGSNDFLLSITVSRDVKPGLRYYPCIRFVLNDETWIDGHLGCFPTGGTPGNVSGGDIRMWGKATQLGGKKLAFVDMVAAVGVPDSRFFGTQEGEGISNLTADALENLKKKGGVLLRFPIRAPESPGNSGDSP